MSSAISAAAKDAFVHCYDTLSHVDQIKADIRSGLRPGEQLRCPYCALPGDISTFDHYLEKASMPELAVYHRNLVPCCWMCNHRRGRTFDGAGERRVLHPFDDAIDQVPDVLCCEVADDLSATFSLLSSAASAAVYARHFEALLLAERYRAYAATVLPEIADSLRGSPMATWIPTLLDQATRTATRDGPWDPLESTCRHASLSIL